MNGAFEDPIGLAGVDCGSSGSIGMLHLVYLYVYLVYFLPFFEKNVYLDMYLLSFFE